jgi:hypothetical protein
VQLGGRLGGRSLQRLYIGGDVDRLDVGELADLGCSTQTGTRPGKAMRVFLLRIVAAKNSMKRRAAC